MNRYRCEMAELHASRAGKQAMTELLLRRQATQGDAPARGRHPLRTALLAAVVTALLATAALALSPTLRDALANALGGFAPYAQDMTRKELSCADQDIKLTVVSALNDGNTIVIYFEAQDLTGDRLDGATRTNAQLQWPENAAWKQGMVFPAEQIAYDERTKTALYCTKFIGDGIPAETLTVQLYGQFFVPGTHEFDQRQSLPDEKIKGEWRLDVPLESLDVTTIPLEQSQTDIAVGPKATKMFLSPISCTIECDPQDGESALGYSLSVFYSDKSAVSGLKSDSNYYSGSYATDHWTFPQPIEPEEVTAIALGLWYVPIENGVAQPGHWLAEQP